MREAARAARWDYFRVVAIAISGISMIALFKYLLGG